MISSLLLALWIAHGLAALPAVLLARCRAEYRPVAMFIVWTLAADLLRAVLMVWGWAPARADRLTWQSMTTAMGRGVAAESRGGAAAADRSAGLPAGPERVL